MASSAAKASILRKLSPVFCTLSFSSSPSLIKTALVRIQLISNLVDRRIDDAIQSFHRAHELVEIFISVATWDVIQRSVLRNEVEIGIAPTHHQDSDLLGGIGTMKPMAANLVIPTVVSGTIVITVIAAYFIFRETLALFQLAGLGCIIIGMLLLYFGKDLAPG